jgi:cell pole-organizing protein PopZ
MTDQRPNDAAMADILASIKRIVAEEDKRFATSPLATIGDVLELTPEMRVGQGDPAEGRRAGAPSPGVAPATGAPTPRLAGGAPPPAAPAPADVSDERIAELARTVVRQELAGAFGQTLTRNVKALIKDEVARALAAREGGGG